MQQFEVHSDLTVVGGGLAGVCAAIAAARQDATVALVQNRPVLGGNASSEVRVWVCGATAHGVHHFARETGIMGELWVENQYRNPEGNPYYWDLVVLEAVRAEPNITLYLNTDVRTVDASGPPSQRTITSVTGWQMGAEKEITFRSPVFADCSGDGLVGFLAGAEHRTGREPRSEYDESWAPEIPDGNTLGSTILFYSKDAGRPEKFVQPSFTRDISKTSIPEHRIIRTDLNGCAYWWIEWGGELDVVDDNERIRDELQAAVYGIWDHIKNSGRYDADNLTLEWIGSVPGKREYRRFLGDHVLTQHDVLGQQPFEDRVAFGGWSIDLHPPGGMYATERGSKHWHPDGNYHIPLRTLYSRNVQNLWMAGRNISASHVAFGTTRVMATCAVLGEAAGLAAAVAHQSGLTPRELATEHFDLVRKALHRADASVLGVADTDPANLALTASVTASSTLRNLAVEVSAGTMALDTDLAMVVPVDPALDGMELLVDATASTTLLVELHDPVKPQNYLPLRKIAEWTVPVEAGEKRWVRIPLRWQPDQPQNALVVLKKNAALAVHVADSALPGTVFLAHRSPAPDEEYPEQYREWKHILPRGGLCFRLSSSAYAVDNVIGGYARPYGGPQLWVSEDLAWDPAPHVELAWAEPVEVCEVTLILDDDVEEDLINLHHHRTPYDVLPTLIRDYEIQTADADGNWHPLVSITNNRRRRQTHRLPTPVTLSRLRILVGATNGAARAHIVSIRAYTTLPSGPTGTADTSLPARGPHSPSPTNQSPTGTPSPQP